MPAAWQLLEDGHPQQKPYTKQIMNCYTLNNNIYSLDNNNSSNNNNRLLQSTLINAFIVVLYTDTYSLSSNRVQYQITLQMFDTVLYIVTGNFPVHYTKQ